MFVSQFTTLRISSVQSDLEQNCFKKGKCFLRQPLNSLFYLLLSVVIRGREARRASREDSSAWRKSQVKRQQVNTLTYCICAGTRARLFGPYVCSRTSGNSLSKKFLAPAPNAAVSSTDAEKEEDESSFQAQTAAEEGSVKVPPLLANLCRNMNMLVSFCIGVCVCVSVPPLSSCVQVSKRIEVHSIHTYVALYKFLPQEQNDLELQ